MRNGLALILLLPWLISAAPQKPALDWPQFLGPDRNATTAAPVGWKGPAPPVLWKRPVGQGFAGPIVAGDKLLIFHRVNDKETLDCLDAVTGKPVWSSGYRSTYTDDFGFDEGPRSTPCVSDGRVYTLGADGAFNCWELATGRNVFSAGLRKQFNAPKGFFGIACSPLVEGDAVILIAGAPNGHGVVAFHKVTGKVLWKATNHEASYASPIGVTIDNHRHVLALTRAGLTSLDPATGAVRFEFPFRPRQHASVTAATPLFLPPRGVFITASYETGAALLKIEGNKPRVLWSSDESLSSHYTTPVHYDGFLYGFHGRQEMGPELRCVELATGKVRWTQAGLGAGSLILANDQLLVLTEKGELIFAAASPKAFVPAARAQLLGFDTRAHPALGNGLLYARDKRNLICVDLRVR